MVETLTNLFNQLKIKADIKAHKIEDSFHIFDISLRLGGNYKKIQKHSTEIALALKSLSEPLIYPIMEEGIVRMEVMISKQNTIFFRDMIPHLNKSTLKLPMILGKFRNGDPLIVDLTEMPHLLVSGSTGSGKSIMLQSIINSLLLSRSVDLALIDPKRVEFSYYDKISNLYGPIARDVESSIGLLEDLIEEMDRRFYILEQSNVRDISSYSGKMSHIVLVIDELADLMMVAKKYTQSLICRLAQKSRACGIHLIIATQRPSVDVVTGLIKANFPSRISCKVTAAVDSRTVLNRNGAETLCGKGDAIIDCPKYSFARFKGTFINEREIVDIAKSKTSIWRKLWTS